MKLLDVVTSPWMIQPSKLLEIRDIYNAHLLREKIDLNSIEKNLGRPLNNSATTYDVENGVAIISLHGVIAKKMNMFSRISGGASTQVFAKAVQQAAKDNDVTSIIIDADGPGGTADGTFEAGLVVNNASKIKKVVSFVDGNALSATYLIASAASKIYISGPTAFVGSIGVVATHVDTSSRDKKDGIVTTDITAGRYKRIASSNAPLTDEGRQSMQYTVDYLYSIFVEKIAEYRDVSVENVLENMADGRVFIGQESIDAGLADGESTLDEMVLKLSNGFGANDLSIVALTNDMPIIINNDLIVESKDMPAEQITKGLVLEKAPEVAESLRQDGINSVDVDSIRHAAAHNELQRIQSVSNQSMPGHEVLIDKLMFDGKTTGPEAAVQVLSAERKAVSLHAHDMQKDSPTPLPFAEHADVSVAKKQPAIENMTIDDQCKYQWSSNPKIRDEFMTYDAFLAYRVADSKEQISIMGK